jgi:hypothetical protein
MGLSISDEVVAIVVMTGDLDDEMCSADVRTMSCRFVVACCHFDVMWRE